MKKSVIFLLLLSIGFGINAQSYNNMNRYQNEWNEVEKLEKDDLPQSASGKVDAILKKAVAEKNTQQIIKSLLFKNKYKAIIDYDNNTGIFEDLENLLKETNDHSDKALLHSMLGELYLNYYRNDRWKIEQRTQLADYVPEDMKEWPSNIFLEKVIAHLNSSVQEKPLLLNKTTREYADIIRLGEDSQEFYPTLYDFLMKRNTELSQMLQVDDLNAALKKKNSSTKAIAGNTNDFIKLDIGEPVYGNDLITLVYYQQFLQSQLDRNLQNAVVLTEIDRYNYMRNKSNDFRTNYALDFLTDLYNRYENNEIVVEIINQIADYYSPRFSVRGGYTGDEEANKNRTLAYEWSKKGIEKFPRYKRIDILKAKIDSFEKPSARISGNSIFYPEKTEKTITLTYNNINRAKVKIYRVTNSNDSKELIKDLVKEFTVELNPKTTYIAEEKNIGIDINVPGTYEIGLEFDKEIKSSEKSTFYISRLQAFCRQKDKQEYEFYVVDRMTGTPLNGATVEITKSNKAVTTVTTDSKGFATVRISDSMEDYSVRNLYKYSVWLKNDKAFYTKQFPYNYQFAANDGEETRTEDESTQIFIDRNIYRPGQTVYFKAILANTFGNQYTTPIANREIDATLYDVNSQEVAEKTLKTNDFGSISGEFVLPQNGITGTYEIEINDVSYYFNVEEYKRPTFQVTFDKIDGTYAFGDDVTVTGHAENFSGIKLQDAEVEYTITKSSFWRWFGPTETIESNTIRTRDDGTFEITFTIPKNDLDPKTFWRNIYTFVVTADVTDLNGETQSGEYSFAVGEVSMILNTNIGDQIDKQSEKTIEIKATNLNGQEITASGTYTLYWLADNDTIRKEVAKGDFSTGEQKLLTERLRKTESGKYVIRLQAKDSNGKDVESENEFILFSENDKRPPIEKNDWEILKETEFNETENAEIIWGISARNITVLYELKKGNKVLQQQQIKFSNENRKFVIPYRSEYGSGVYAVFTYMVDEEVYQRSIQIVKKKEEKKLNLKLEVFRDKLRPGQHEEWRISVKDNRSNPAVAELLASMYDSSIDQLRQTEPWIFRELYPSYTYPIAFDSNNMLYGVRSVYSFNGTDIKSPPSFSFDELYWFGFSFSRSQRQMRIRTSINQPEPTLAEEYGSTSNVLGEVEITAVQRSAVGGLNMSITSLDEALQGKIAGVDIITADNEDALELADVVTTGSMQKVVNLESGSALAGGAQPQIRSNFNETAFFYPHLRTDANGETVFSFTVPESNTIWKFRALAYDQSFNTGTLEALAVSRKELMVTPNLPRFMRHGDRTSISTKISNLSENSISGNVRIEFFDPVTEKLLNIAVQDKVKVFSLEKDASGSAVWTFDVPTDIDLIGCRIIAESESFSDGEQHAISVLPNRMLVTESMPMNVNEVGTENFVFNNFVNNQSKSLSNYRLTLEYASNPAWYAVQALPSLSNPSNENAVNWFASYYVNTLGHSIGVQYPKVAAMINAWKKSGESKESLLFNLQQNEELKSVLLEETPWVLEAKSETEQMQRLSLLLDLNNTTQKTNQAIEKLAELQNSDGSWAWMKGFYPSRSITQYILYGFTNLIQLGAVQYPSHVKEMQMNAIRFIDKKIVEDYESLKKNNKNWKEINDISTNQLEYIYVRSFYRDIPINVETREAERFYTSIVEKNWTALDLYQRSLLAIVLRKNGNKQLADRIIQSLRERAVIDKEKGMYWANNKSNVFLSLSAVSTHVFIMEAFRDANAPQSEIDLMKLWLLKQKQTQQWESTHASIDAIYALLSTGSDWFSDNSDVTIQIGNQTVEPENKQTGTGYFKESWEKSAIRPDMGTVQITKTDDSPSYGALYWQYYEDLNKITESKGVLNVEKMLFIEKSSGTDKVLTQITGNNPLKVSDKVIIRLTIRVDRDMEFVQLKDMRASCFEPIETISGNRWQNGTIYYQSTKDASTNFYFHHLPKGTYVFEYPVYVNRTGDYSNGITTIQCMYTPEFVSHTKGIKVSVK